MTDDIEQSYREEFDYLLAYAKGDWLGFGPIIGSAAQMLGAAWTREKEDALVLRLLADLLAAGVRAGDLTASDERPFEPWPGDAAAVLARLERELKAFPESPDTGDICWFTVMRSG